MSHSLPLSDAPRLTQNFGREATTILTPGDSFFSAGQIPQGKIYTPEFIKSVVSFKNYLAARGVDLILVRIPFKGEIVDDLFAPVPLDRVTNPYLLRMYKELLEDDVEIVTDIIPKARAARFKYPLMYWYQKFDEPHPAEGMAWEAAKALAVRIARYDKVRSAPKVRLSMKKTTTQTAKTDGHTFYWPAGNPAYNEKEMVQFEGITTANGHFLLPRQGEISPVLVAGSSFIDFPYLGKGANIPSYLAYETGLVPDMLFRAGSDSGIPREIAREGDAFLKNRVVCIFPMVPWVSTAALALPPIIDPAKFKKIPIATYGVNEFQKKIHFGTVTAGQSVGYTAKGSLAVKPLSPNTHKGGNIRLDLPLELADYPYIMIEIESRIGDDAEIKVKYGNQSDTVHKSSTQKNITDYFIFKSTEDRTAEFNFDNIRSITPTVINKISIIGLK